MLLKSCAAAVTEQLAILFRHSFSKGNIPTNWETASIVPIYMKKGLLASSLASVPFKKLESLIKDKMVDLMKKNNIQTKHQHGFLQLRSCLTNLLEALEAWTEALDNGPGVDVLFLDYIKVFDSVPHQRLIEKLRNLGIQNNLLR